MPVVFVHGVATRRNPGYERGVAARNAMFRRYLYPTLHWDDCFDPFTAYWGGDAAEFRWHHASLPKEDVEAFGAAESVEDRLLVEISGGGVVDADAPLSSLARRSVEDAVDLIWASAAQEVRDAGVAQALAALAYRASCRLPELECDPALTQANDDQEWINALAVQLAGVAPEPSNLDEVESFGGGAVWDRLSESVIRLRSAAGRLGGGAAANLLRADIHRRAALFLGDVLFYLDRRGDRDHPGPIVNQIVQTLESAIEAGPPLVVVAHSMGGGIVYDVLSYYRPDIRVEMLVTVGSQVGLFEELCLLQAGKQAGCPDGPTRVAKLDNVEEWINVFDYNDMLGFATERIFEGAKDFGYSTGKGIFTSHSSYFTMPSFYRRLAERLKVRELCSQW
jgi:pimeloyl-ACP methyl ester carboxylesterase